MKNFKAFFIKREFEKLRKLFCRKFQSFFMSKFKLFHKNFQSSFKKLAKLSN